MAIGLLQSQGLRSLVVLSLEATFFENDSYLLQNMTEGLPRAVTDFVELK